MVSVDKDKLCLLSDSEQKLRCDKVRAMMRKNGVDSLLVSDKATSLIMPSNAPVISSADAS